MNKPYSYKEANQIDEYYSQDIPMDEIARIINNEFHNGETVRNTQDIMNVIDEDDEWLINLD